MQPLKSLSAVTSTTPFMVQIVFSILINLSANFGFSWALLTKWGELPIQPIFLWEKNSVDMQAGPDLAITAFLVAFLTFALSTPGVEVRAERAVPCVGCRAGARVSLILAAPSGPCLAPLHSQTAQHCGLSVSMM